MGVVVMLFEIGHIYRLAVLWRFATASDIVNVWHAECLASSSGVPSEEKDDLSMILFNLYGNVLNGMSNLNVHQSVSLYDETTNSLMITIGALLALNGANSSQATSPTNAAMIYARTSVPRMIGRKYLPPLTELSWDAGVLQAAALADAQDMADRWGDTLNATNGTSLRFGVFSNTNGFELPLEAVASNLTATQRSRRQGRGS